MDFGRNHFFPCDEGGQSGYQRLSRSQGRNPGMFNEGGVTVLPRDPQHDRQGTGSSTFIFRVRNRQSLNFGAVDQTLNFPDQGTPSPNRIWSWQNALRHLAQHPHASGLPNASGTPSPLVIRFDEDGDGDPIGWHPHFMQMTRRLGNTDAVWTYVVQPTDRMAVDGGVGGPFTNGGRGKTWDNNFECFLYGPLVDPRSLPWSDDDRLQQPLWRRASDRGAPGLQSRAAEVPVRDQPGYRLLEQAHPFDHRSQFRQPGYAL